jgi:hypothetical protein
MEYFTGFLTFLAFAGAGFVAFLVYRQREQDSKYNEWVTVVSPNISEIQSLQLESGTNEQLSWNGYRNELCLYRLRVRRGDAEAFMSRKRFASIRIER